MLSRLFPIGAVELDQLAQQLALECRLGLGKQGGDPRPAPPPPLGLEAVAELIDLPQSFRFRGVHEASSGFQVARINSSLRSTVRTVQPRRAASSWLEYPSSLS